MKVKSHAKPVVNFESNSKSVKRNKRFYSKKYHSDNHTNNQQMCIDFLKPISKSVSVKNVLQLLLCAQLLKFFIRSIAHVVVYKNGSIVKN